MRRLIYDLKLWWLEISIALLHEQLERVRNDLADFYKRRSELLVRNIEQESP